MTESNALTTKIEPTLDEPLLTTDNAFGIPLNTAHEDGVSILVNMVQTGTVDPWDIDVVAVADEYLKAVSNLENNDLQKSDLKMTGKVLLYLAILLRLKSDKLAGLDILLHQDDAHLDDDFWGDDDGGFDPLQLMTEGMFPNRDLNELIERRTSTKEHRIRKVTIKDLIRELKRYERLEQEHQIKRQLDRHERSRVKDNYSNLTSAQIESLAHDESIEDNVLRLKALLEHIFTSDSPKVGLNELMDEGQLDQISAYLALLFLAGRGQLDIYQDTFYADVWVGPPESKPAEEDENDIPPLPKRIRKAPKPKSKPKPTEDVTDQFNDELDEELNETLNEQLNEPTASTETMEAEAS